MYGNKKNTNTHTKKAGIYNVQNTFQRNPSNNTSRKVIHRNFETHKTFMFRNQNAPIYM